MRWFPTGMTQRYLQVEGAGQEALLDLGLDGQDPQAGSGGGIRQRRNAEEATAPFWEGLREMASRNDEAAFEIFDLLSRYNGDAPPHLVATARAGRDYLDPARTAEQKARTLFHFFTPTLIQVR